MIRTLGFILREKELSGYLKQGVKKKSGVLVTRRSGWIHCRKQLYKSKTLQSRDYCESLDEKGKIRP